MYWDILSLEEGHFGRYEPQSYSFIREGGRTFVSTRGKIALISEVLPDGTLHDLAAVAGTHHFGYGCEWKPPQAYIDASVTLSHRAPTAGVGGDAPVERLAHLSERGDRC